MSIESPKFNSSYYTYNQGEYQYLPLRRLVNIKKENLNPTIWSARISTGLFGLTNCVSGNRGPRSDREIILAIGNEGLSEFIGLGFIPCPSCHPERIPDFWEIGHDAIKQKYNFSMNINFMDKNILKYDARRLAWEKIHDITKTLPDRIYLPQNLTEKDISMFRDRLGLLEENLPDLGFYDRTNPVHFTRYP